MCRFWHYINCLFACSLHFLPSFLSPLLSSFLMLYFLLIYFLICLLLDLSIYSFQNRPILFSGRTWFQFFGFILCCCIFCCGCMFLLLLCLFQFVSTKPRDWLGRTSPKWPILCQVGRSTLTQLLTCSLYASIIMNCSSMVEYTFRFIPP